MSRGFGSTFGTGATDIIKTNYAKVSNGKRSYSMWSYANGAGASSLGRVMNAGDGGNANLETWSYNGTTTDMAYGRGFSGTSGTFRYAPPTTGVWHHYLLTYDASNVANIPVVYIDGVSSAITTLAAPVGTATTSTTANFCVGNRGSDSLRNWDGMHAHFTIWDGIILGRAEAVSLAAGIHPMLFMPDSIVCYVPLDGINKPEWDFINGTTNTITATKLGNREPPVMAFGRTRDLYDALSLSVIVNRRTLGPRVGSRSVY